MNLSTADLKAQVIRPGSLFDYAGPLDQEGLTRLGGDLRDRLKELEVPSEQILRVFAVFVELGQNIIRYGWVHPDEWRPLGALAVSGSGDRYEVVGGNWILATHIPGLQAKLERLSRLDEPRLKELYQSERRRNRDPKILSTGLGLLDMSRRAAGPLDFRFEPAAQGVGLFCLGLKVGPRMDLGALGSADQMEPLLIEAGKYTPAVRFDPARRLLELVGESYPENTAQFYAPLFGWIDRFFATLRPGEQVEVVLEIWYFNSSSSKALMDLFDRLLKGRKRGLELRVRWRYDPENQSAKENGEEFAEDLTSLDFRLESKP
ncbi:MAG: SiaC family regulatory phosphoprotein [bacterium]|nr:SiaC family regulatory phosphoprotein [bacterium]